MSYLIVFTSEVTVPFATLVSMILPGASWLTSLTTLP